MDQKKFCPRDLTEAKNYSIGYTYPKAHTGKSNYVDYFYFIPSTGEKKRVKKFFDHIKKKSERKAEMENYIHRTASLLRTGWRPFHCFCFHSTVVIARQTKTVADPLQTE